MLKRDKGSIASVELLKKGEYFKMEVWRRGMLESAFKILSVTVTFSLSLSACSYVSLVCTVTTNNSFGIPQIRWNG